MDIKRRNQQYTKTCPVYLLASFGCASTILSELLSYPFECIKTKLQMNGTQGCQKYRNFRSVIDSTNSLKGFYKGLNASMLKIIPYSTTKIFAYEFLSITMTGKIVETSYLRKLSASISACALALLTGNLGDLLRIRMINNPQQITLIEALSQSYHQTGLTGFFRGYYLNLTTVLTISSLEIALFDRIKKFFINNFGYNSNGTSINVISGTLTGISAALVSAPLDGFKTRYMNQLVSQTNYWETFLNVLKEEGLLALYKGTIPYCIKLPFGSVATFVCYEQLKRSII